MTFDDIWFHGALLIQRVSCYKKRQTVWHNYNKLAPYGTDSRLFTTDVSAKFKVA